MRITTQTVQAQVLGEGDWIAVTEVSQLCHIGAHDLHELVELGVFAHREPHAGEWQVPAAALPRLRVMARLMRDLGVNASGAVLAVELLEAQRQLQRRIASLEQLLEEE
ncbi:MAG: MerR family transcriptional regulator [Proteobacteria bacterium]|nr:MerR family transcriptional regulator [Pseudomonadota bacterium]